MSTVHDKLVKAIRARTSRKELFGTGILAADRYVGSMVECLGDEQCVKLYGDLVEQPDWEAMKKEAESRLTHSNEDMVVEEKHTSGNWKDAGIGDIEVPKRALIVFRNTITSPRKDRDGDILRSEGAEVDPRMLLLWQHIPTLPIGKMLNVHYQGKDRVSLNSCIVDMNPLCHDAAVMVDEGMARFSHGFQALEVEELKDAIDGFDIKRYGMLEESVVSIPSNVDAEVEEVLLSLVDGKKLTSGFMKARAEVIRSKRATPVPGVQMRFDVDYVGDVLNHVNPGDSITFHKTGECSVTKKEGCGCGENEEAVSELDDGACREIEEVASDEIVIDVRWVKSDAQLNQAFWENSEAWHPDVTSVREYCGERQTRGFDPNLEHLEASSLELDWVSRYLGCEVKELLDSSSHIPAYRMWSWLTALKVHTEKWSLEDTRNITDSGKERPPEHEVIQLNSTQRDTFLIDGIRFYTTPEGKCVLKVTPTWTGVVVKVYVKQSEMERSEGLISKCWDWAIENNFLKGEAFQLSGDFIERDASWTWDKVFMEPENAKAVQGTVGKMNKKGKDFVNRGTVLMGPPGTGKTLSGRIALNQLKDATFIWISARDFYYMGATGGLMSGYDLAKELAPAVLFIEDVDNWISERTVDVLKTEMDGIGRSRGVWTVLTTNYPEKLPTSLLDRPGRFHDVLNFHNPTEKIRRAMLEKWLPGLSDKEILHAVKETDGWSGAHMYELAEYAKDVAEDDEVEIGKALLTSLTKIAEQKELISQTYLAGSNYRGGKCLEVDTTDMRHAVLRHEEKQAESEREFDCTVTIEERSKDERVHESISVLFRDGSPEDWARLHPMTSAMAEVLEEDKKAEAFRDLIK